MSDATPFLLRVVRGAALHADTFEEVEAEPRSIRQAVLVVALACVSAAAGAWLETLTWRPGGAGLSLALGLEMAARAIELAVLWLGGSAFAYMVGSSFFRGPDTETDYAELLRTVGFAFGPALLSFLACLPPAALGVGVLWVLRVWVIVAATVAVRAALDFTTPRAVGTVALGWVIGWLVMWGAVSVLVQLMDLLG